MLKNKQHNRAARIKRLKTFLRNNSPTRQLWSSQLRAHVLSIAQLQHRPHLLLDLTWHTFYRRHLQPGWRWRWAAPTRQRTRAHTPPAPTFYAPDEHKALVAAHAHQPRDHRSGCRRCQSAETPPPLPPVWWHHADTSPRWNWKRTCTRFSPNTLITVIGCKYRDTHEYKWIHILFFILTNNGIRYI